MENTNEVKAMKTCLITIVQPGLPDSVLRVGPSDHEQEKIWLDRQPGIERWAAIKQLMVRFCPRGKYIPEPAYYHPTTGKKEDLAILLINKPEDIPSIVLDGAILSAPPANDRDTRKRPDNSAKMAAAETEQLKDQVKTLSAQVATLVTIVTAKTQEPAPRKPGRPKKEDAVK